MLTVIYVRQFWTYVAVMWTTASVCAGLINGHDFSQEEQDWWAVQPLRDSLVPEAGAGWARNEIDRFVAARLEAAGLDPAAEADRYELVRRAYFDLHGLPPTPEQVNNFVQDDRPDAWERLIDELLSNRAYGERWAQHWLDVVRYAETDGYRADAFRPGAYRYRDYVIDSLNADKAYDRFVQEQLAADELGVVDPEILIATAFLRHGIYEHNQRNARMHWGLIMDEMTRVTGETLLGLGVGCAQCHDHKFDPILQKDYYQLQAYLSTTFWPTDRKWASEDEARAYAAKNSEWEEATADIRRQMSALLESEIDNKISYTVKQFPEDIQEMYWKPDRERSPYEAQMAALVQRQVDAEIHRVKPERVLKEHVEQLAEYEKLKAQLEDFAFLKPSDLPTALVVSDIRATPVPTFIASRKGQVEVQPGLLTLLGQSPPVVKPTAHTTGRRLALAKWITQPDNMLSTRVMVNRIWQHHFNRGIVATPNDFGTLGKPPSHPALLDWLARRLVEEGWRMKAIHRLIMNSATYRQTARRAAPDVASESDPDNTMLWRYPPQRLSAEQIRDAMLLVSGQLKAKSGGPSTDGKTPVRSVYVKKLRNTPDPVLDAFDAPQGFDSVPERQQTATPTQSLLLSNNDWPVARAKAMAVKLMSQEKQLTPELINAAYQLAFARPASEAERLAAMAFVRSQAAVIENLPVSKKDDGKAAYVSADKHFPALEHLGVNTDALNLSRTGPFQQVDLQNAEWLSDEFSIQAVARLESIYPNASVNTLVSRWSGSQSGTGGWALGITSTKSAYEPRNFIMQIVGEDVAGNITYEVIDSNIEVPLNKPLYLAVVVKPIAGQKGTVTFYVRDLSSSSNPMVVSVVKHSITRNVQVPTSRLLIGGRDQGLSHRWHGQIARLSISDALLSPDQLIVSEPFREPDYVFDYTFDATAEAPVPGGAWHVVEKNRVVADDVIPHHEIEAMTDFCHALLMSNEFLYLH